MQEISVSCAWSRWFLTFLPFLAHSSASLTPSTAFFHSFLLLLLASPLNIFGAPPSQNTRLVRCRFSSSSLSYTFCSIYLLADSFCPCHAPILPSPTVCFGSTPLCVRIIPVPLCVASCCCCCSTTWDIFHDFHSIHACVCVRVCVCESECVWACLHFIWLLSFGA